MKVIRDLEISASEFFNGLLDKVIDDINTNTDKEVKKEDLKKGFKLVCRGENIAQRMTFEIIDYQQDKVYKAKRKAVNGTVSVHYIVKPNDKGGINVTFEQIFPEENKKQGALMKGFSETIYLGRMTDSLYDIQKTVLLSKEERKEQKNFLMPSFWSDINKEIKKKQKIKRLKEAEKNK